jgi:hypothetical protein
MHVKNNEVSSLMREPLGMSLGETPDELLSILLSCRVTILARIITARRAIRHVTKVWASRRWNNLVRERGLGESMGDSATGEALGDLLWR